MSTVRVRLFGLLAIAALLAMVAQLSGHLPALRASKTPEIAPAPRNILAIQVIGPPIKIFDHLRDQLEPDNTPDAQITAWRDAEGTVNLMIPHTEAYRMRGPDLRHLSIDAHKIYSSATSAHREQENMFNYSHWLMGPYTLDGRRFYTLSHSEWYGCLPALDCDRATADGESAETNSWANSVNSFVSADGGASWQLNVVRGNHVVAKSDYRWTGSKAQAQKIYLRALNHSGMFQPSRVIREGAYFYAIAYYIHRDFKQVDAYPGRDEAPIDRFGYVLMRTPDITDPNAWQGWEGQARFAPLASARFDVFLPRHNGEPLNAAPPQIVFDTNARCYVLIHALYGGENPVYYMITRSLATPEWSDAIPIIGSDRLISGASGEGHGLNDSNYPSVIDADSSGFNFEFTNGSPLLFFSTAPGSFGGDARARDIYRVALSIIYH